MTAQAFRDNQIGLIRIFKEYSKAFQKDGAKILINTKVIKVLLTEGVNPISKIIAKFLSMKESILC